MIYHREVNRYSRYRKYCPDGLRPRWFFVRDQIIYKIKKGTAAASRREDPTAGRCFFCEILPKRRIIIIHLPLPLPIRIEPLCSSPSPPSLRYLQGRTVSSWNRHDLKNSGYSAHIRLSLFWDLYLLDILSVNFSREKLHQTSLSWNHFLYRFAFIIVQYTGRVDNIQAAWYWNLFLGCIDWLTQCFIIPHFAPVQPDN